MELEAAMRAALAVPVETLGRGSAVGLTVLEDQAASTRHMVDSMLAAYRAALAAGRAQAVFIVPVGPVGQYESLAARSAAEGIDLSRLVLLNMDEYLGPDGAWLGEDDPLGFRHHMRTQLLDRLPRALAPRVEFPDPRDPAASGRLIEALGGVDVAYGGVGVTGHLAFNDPPEPGEPDDVEGFAALPTRVVTLSRETRVIAAVNAAGGNLLRIPHRAVTLGMREILGARQVRVYVHRPYHGAMLRLLLHGPVTATVPASLLQRHPDAAAVATRAASARPEPQ